MNELATAVSERDHRQGHMDAEFVLVEYGDYECPHCKAAYPAVKAVQAEMGKRLCFVYRHFCCWRFTRMPNKPPRQPRRGRTE
jgi:protein-disulfide isomerase